MHARLALCLSMALVIAGCNGDETATNEGSGVPTGNGAGGDGASGKGGSSAKGGTSGAGSAGKSAGGSSGTGGSSSTAGQGGSSGTSSVGGASGAGAGSGATGGSSASGGSGGTGASGGSGPFGGGGSAGSGGSQASAGQGGAGGSGGTSGAGGSGGSGTSSDPFEQARQVCIDTINMYRQTKGISPMTRRTDQEMCVDAEADHDATVNKFHDAFAHGMTCGGGAQNECPNFGDPVSGITSCLALMWGEKDREVCKGCDTCDYPYNNCTDCTFLGTNGTDGCGHYLNMKSQVLSQVACGFSNKGWFAQNYY